MRIGVMFDCARPPEALVPFARELEELNGVDDLWVVEDLTWSGAVASSAIALGATERLRVGLGIAAAPLRNPVLLAMEWAMLAQVYPGRFVGGIGHGVGEWMTQVGAGTRHKLALLQEETVRMSGTVITIDDVKLVHTPDEVPPVVAGVVKPRSLALAGKWADGVILAEGHTPEQVREALSHAAPTGPFETIAFAALALDPPSAAPTIDGQAAFLGVAPDDVYVLGPSAEEAAAGMRALAAAGATTVVLRPLGTDPSGQVRAVLAALGR
jgi:5,10-methylenetetrahydromethanopterin reductase